MIAFDSGALVAHFKAEDGALVVRQMLIDHKGEMCIHAVNLLEVHYNFRRERDAAYADDILDQIKDTGIEIRNDLDVEFLRDTSFHPSITKCRWATPLAWLWRGASTVNSSRPTITNSMPLLRRAFAK